MINNGTIPYKELLELHSNYQPTHDYLSKKKMKEETQSIWFELDDNFRQFLTELLNSSREVSGLRVYLGEYKVGNTPPGTTDEDYGSKLTIGMIATKEVGGKHIDHPDEVEEKTNLAFAAYNHGKICPPDICPV
jgi:hypothetical protein